MKHAEETIPAQRTGRATDFGDEQEFKNKNQAAGHFREIVGRLLNISEWHRYAGSGSSRFTLTNNLGKETDGLAREGLFFNIDLPVPGSNAGDGLEWVMIERITAEGNSRTNGEYVSMSVRPVPDPRHSRSAIAHFYKDVSTSTFIVERTGKKVTVGIHGRNETPNNEEVGLHDKVRNTVVALSARIGLAGPQWKKLAAGLIRPHAEHAEAPGNGK